VPVFSEFFLPFVGCNLSEFAFSSAGHFQVSLSWYLFPVWNGIGEKVKGSEHLNVYDIVNSEYTPIVGLAFNPVMNRLKITLARRVDTEEQIVRDVLSGNVRKYRLAPFCLTVFAGYG
jgi:hypothetical protein